tara:strand:+ start:174026 stop:174301 length:276 start_codon:yes stop_codon:yes gene_type:complete
MKELPKNVEVYKKTNVFDENSIPKGILNDHSTKPNVWGKINIVEGKLLYVVQSNPVEKVELSVEKFGVVEPEVRHYVKPLGKVKFFVEFLK